MHWLLHIMGVDDVSGRWYGFWSGFGSDLAELAAGLSIAGAYAKHHECHQKGCWRMGHPDGDGEVFCRKHLLAKQSETH